MFVGAFTFTSLTFGHTGISAWNLGNTAGWQSAYPGAYSPAFDGTLVSISVYLRKNSGVGTHSVKAGIWKDVGGGLNTATLVATGQVLNVTAAAQWVVVPVSCDIYALSSYYLGWTSDSTWDFAGDNGAPLQTKLKILAYATFGSDPFGVPDANYGFIEAAIYGTYNPAGGSRRLLVGEGK